MRSWLPLVALALALAGCAKTGAPRAEPIGKPQIPAELLEHRAKAPPLAPHPTRLVRLPGGAVVEELRP